MGAALLRRVGPRRDASRSVARPSGMRGLLVGVIGALTVAGLAIPQAAHASTVTHSRTTTEHRIAVAVVNLLNAERRAHHLKPLVANAQLEVSARRHDVTMAHYDTMSHQLPHEAFFANRIRAAGYHWSWAGENIGWNSQINTAGVLQLETMMYNEKAPDNGHRLNILSSHFKNVGVDVFVDQAHQRIWLTTDFAAH